MPSHTHLWRDGQAAIIDALKACQLSDWSDPWSLTTLAAAYAENGDFPKAIETQKKAVSIAPEELKSHFQTWLKTMQSNQPIRDASIPPAR